MKDWKKILAAFDEAKKHAKSIKCKNCGGTMWCFEPDEFYECEFCGEIIKQKLNKSDYGKS